MRLAITGSNANQRPKADQNGVSFAKLRILYEMTTFGAVHGFPDAGNEMNGGEVNWISVRNNGASSSGK